MWCIKKDNRSVCNNDKAIRLHNVFFCCLQFKTAELFYFKLLTEGNSFCHRSKPLFGLFYLRDRSSVHVQKIRSKISFFFFISNRSLTGEDLCLKPYNALPPRLLTDLYVLTLSVDRINYTHNPFQYLNDLKAPILIPKLYIQGIPKLARF